MKSAASVVVRPLLTEKGTRLRERDRQILFEVASDASRTDVRRAVEALFNVKVTEVRTQIVRGKVRRMGRFVGRRPNWKKAIVTLAEGADIDFFAMGA
jgi:large subunit ribosomal protein L23